MRTARRRGVATLPISIFFIALVAAAAYATANIASGQSNLANTQLSTENTIAARQAELSGLSATPTGGGGSLQIKQSSGVHTTIGYAIVQTQKGKVATGPVDFTVSPGQTITVNVTSIAQSLLGQGVSNLVSVTLVTARGLFITSQVQTAQKTKQVTTYQQQSVQKTGTALVGYNVYQDSPGYYSCPSGWSQSGSTCSRTTLAYNVYQTTAGYYSCPNGGSLQGSSCVSTQPATWNNGYYSCPSGWSLVGSACSQQQTYYTWVPGYYTYEQVPVYVQGYWSQYYVPGYWQTYQYWVSGYWSQYSYTTSYSYQTWQWVSTGGYWTITWYHMYASIACLGGHGLCLIDILYPIWTWVATGYWSVVNHMVYVVNVVNVWNPGYLATGQYWVSGYWASYYVPGYLTTQTIQVWHQGYYQANTQTVTTSSTWNPAYYSCPSGGSLNGASCVASYTAAWNAPATTYLGQQSSCPSGGQYSCTPVYATQVQPADWNAPATTYLGQESSCPSGTQYSCSAVYGSYTYSVTEMVPVTQTITYQTLSFPTSQWLIGG